jgi:hypothetical protein
MEAAKNSIKCASVQPMLARSIQILPQHFSKCDIFCRIYMCPKEGKLVVSGHDRLIKCAVVLNVPCKRSCSTVGLSPAWPMWNHVEQ